MNGKKILIVDDDQSFLVGFAARLQANGYQVFSTQTATGAIELVRGEKPDLMVLDLGLPAGDGFSVLEQIKGMSDIPAVPTIILSARDAAGNSPRALHAGALAYFQKPPNTHELLKAIRLAVGEQLVASKFSTG